MLVSLLLLAASSIAVGCGGNSSDGGGGGGGKTCDGVCGTIEDTFDSGHGAAVKGPSEEQISGLVAHVTTNGEDKKYTGTIDTKAGTFSIPGVPEGPYVLAISYEPDADGTSFTRYVALTERELDFNVVRDYRMGLVPMKTTATVKVSASLTKPWQTFTEDDMNNVTQPNDDLLVLYSRSVSVTGQTVGDSGAAGAPADQATSLAGWEIDLTQVTSSYYGGVGEFSKAKSDDLTFLHNVAVMVTDPTLDPSDPWSIYGYTSTQESFSASPFDLVDGGSATITGSFKATAQKMLDLDFSSTQLAKVLADAPKRDPLLDSVELLVVMEPGSPHPDVGVNPALFDLFLYSQVTYQNQACAGAGCDPTACPSGCDLGTATPPGNYKHSFSYGNPFAYGQELFEYFYYYGTDVSPLLPNATSQVYLSGQMTSTLPIKDASGKTFDVTLGLPTDVVVGGKSTPLDAVTKGVGLTPVVKWKPPSLGKPDQYLVRISSVDAMGTTLVATYATSEASFTIPAGILKDGDLYSVNVEASVADGFDPTVLAAAAGAKFSAAQTYTGLFSP